VPGALRCGPGAGGAVGDGGGGSSGTALTGIAAKLSADMPTPAAIAAAPARRVISIVNRYLSTLFNIATECRRSGNAELLCNATKRCQWWLPHLGAKFTCDAVTAV
jgi:hypothetical protein